jgi:uncharacterized protein
MIDEPRLKRQVELHPYPLLFATISGAHLYGFPSPDSDYDLRGVHLLSLEEIVGLKMGQETVEKSGVHDGLEIDLVTHDAHKFFGLLLKKNGYVLEQVFSPLVVHTTPEHAELKEIARHCVPEVDCGFVVVPRRRGQQLKEQAQLDGWLRDGSAEYVASLCAWD